MNSFTFTSIGTVTSCFKEKFGVPRQAGLVPQARGCIHMSAPFHTREALGDLEGCSHIWIQFVFHLQKGRAWKPRIKAPRLGGNRSLSVFASRSPKRPNPIGLSVVALDGIRFGRDEAWLDISGLDLVEGTPVLDIKPYVPYADCVSHAVCPLASAPPAHVPVQFAAAAEMFLQARAQCGEGHWRALLQQTLAQDPRPAFHDNDARIYGVAIGGVNVLWRCVSGQTEQGVCIEVLSVEQPA